MPPASGGAYADQFRTPDARWWHPLRGLAYLAATFVTISLLVYGGAAGIVSAIDDPERLSTDDLSELGSRPGFLIGNLLLAGGMLAAVVAVRTHPRGSPGHLLSVDGTFRWPLFGTGFAVALAVAVPVSVLYWLAPGGSADTASLPGGSEAVWPGTGAFLGLAVLIVATTPLQAAGEEFVFRGYLVQAIGVWTRSRWVGGVVTSLLFALAHGTQGPWLFADRFVLGLAAWWVTLRTGGLETAVALHVSNNLLTLLASAGAGRFEDAFTVTDLSLTTAAVDVASYVVIVVLAARLAARRGVVATGSRD